MSVEGLMRNVRNNKFRRRGGKDKFHEMLGEHYRAKKAVMVAGKFKNNPRSLVPPCVTSGPLAV